LAGVDSVVGVSAGVQLDELIDVLWKRGYSLPTGSIIPHVTAVGLAATGGHGVGKDQPSFAGLIQSLRIVTHKGELAVVDASHPDFETIRGAHLGLCGIVISIELRCVPRFWMHEERTPLTLDSMIIELPDLLERSDYLTLSMVPTHKFWDVRSWKRVHKQPERLQGVHKSQWLQEVEQHFEVETGAQVLKCIDDVSLHPLLGSYLKLVARAAIAPRRRVRIDTEPHIAHYQVAFPKSIEECSIVFPLTIRTLHTLEAVLRNMHQWIKRSASNQQYPVSYAVYVRFFRGTDGGLSSSAIEHRRDEQFVCAVEALTHFGNPYWPAFREQFMELVCSIPGAKFHLGKFVPAGFTVADLYPEKTVLALGKALDRWYEHAPRKSPFLNEWLRTFLGPVLH
jgi:L-gulonolactone oxidase